VLIRLASVKISFWFNMTKNKIIKYILFGTAFLCLLFVLSHLSISFKGGLSIHGSIARATIEGEGPGDILGWIVGVLLNFGFGIFNNLLVVAGKLMNWVFSIETYSNIPAINTSWGVLRDLSNMFFIPVLMVAAVATILRYDKYSFKNMLKPLLISIVFINFSRTIANIVIDFTQVLTRSFLSFSSSGGISEGIVNTMGLTGIFQDTQVFEKGGTKFIGTWGMALNTFLALLVVAIAAIVIGVAVVMLFTRMIALWILIAISPIVWGLYAIPDTQKYLGQWWGKFKQYAFFAPVFAFFIWFAILVVRAGGYSAETNKLPASMLSGTSKFFADPKSIINYMFSIGILIFGLKYAQKDAGDLPFVKSLAGKAEGYIKGAGKSVGVGTLKAVTPYRTVNALRAEHKERSELKEKLKAKDAGITAGSLYKAKDIVSKKLEPHITGTETLRKVGRIVTTKLPLGENLIREEAYGKSVREKRMKDETEKTRLEKLKAYKDAPPDAEDVQKKLVAKGTSEGERKALAQYLAENTGNFSKEMEKSTKEFTAALTALGGEKTALGQAFMSKVKKSRLDLVVQHKVDANNAIDGNEKLNFNEEIASAVKKGMTAKDIAGQRIEVFGDTAFVDAVNGLPPKIMAGLAKSNDMNGEKWAKLGGKKDSEEEKKKKESEAFKSKIMAK